MTGLEHPWILVYVAGPGTNPPCIRGMTVQILLFWLRMPKNYSCYSAPGG